MGESVVCHCLLLTGFLKPLLVAIFAPFSLNKYSIPCGIPSQKPRVTLYTNSPSKLQIIVPFNNTDLQQFDEITVGDEKLRDLTSDSN